MDREGPSSRTRRAGRARVETGLEEAGPSTSRRQTRLQTLQDPTPQPTQTPPPRASISTKPPSAKTIKLGAEFRTYDDFEEVYRQFKDKYNHPFSCPSSQYNYLLGGKGRTVPGQKYKFRAFKCSFSGSPDSVRTRGKGHRPNQTYLALGCPAGFRLNLDQNRDVQVITKCNLVHNHPLIPDMMDKVERKKYGKTLPCGQSLNRRGVSEARSFREDSQPNTPESLEALYRLNTSHNFPAFRRDLTNREPVDTSRLLREGLPHLASPATASTSAVAAVPASNPIAPSFAAMRIEAEPVEPEQRHRITDREALQAWRDAEWNEEEIEATVSVVRRSINMNRLNSRVNAETTTVDPYQYGNGNENQENEPWQDGLDYYVNEVARYPAVNGADELQELVDGVRFIADEITY